jgi:hypothetical protein
LKIDIDVIDHLHRVERMLQSESREVFDLNHAQEIFSDQLANPTRTRKKFLWREAKAATMRSRRVGTRAGLARFSDRAIRSRSGEISSPAC